MACTIGQKTPLFRKAKKLQDHHVNKLLQQITTSVLTFLKNKGYLDQHGDVVDNPVRDDLFRDFSSVEMATDASIAGRIAFGENAGKRVNRIGAGFGYSEEIPMKQSRLCYGMNGFTLHAARSINTHSRKNLEQLISYIARGPLSNQRLQLVEDRKVKLSLKRHFSDGTSHLVFTYSEFIEKLTAIIPPPKSHLVRWSGSFAPNCQYRRKIVLKPEVKKGFHFEDDDEEKSTKNYRWAELLARVFGIDVLKCLCGGRLKPVATIKDAKAITRYLKHVGLPHLPPPRAPPRSKATMLDFNQDIYDDETKVIHLD